MTATKYHGCEIIVMLEWDHKFDLLGFQVVFAYEVYWFLQNLEPTDKTCIWFDESVIKHVFSGISLKIVIYIYMF